MWDTLDDQESIMGARTRHIKIANVVWELCHRDMGSESLIHEAITALNLNHQADVIAFDHFVRSDRLVNSLTSSEGRIKFFDIACRKDPESPYVRQHYARMLARDDLDSLALDQIEKAISIDSSVKVLYHTKGMILMKLAHTLKSKDMATRRLVQSENAFRQGLTYNRRDDFCYQGLARLYIGWAEKYREDEFDDAIAKAEEIINEGLKVVRSRNTLWQESARIQKLLGNDEQNIQRLARAVEANPTSAISRYLLARAYRTKGEPAKAVTVLQDIIDRHLEEPRIIAEYVLSKYMLGTFYSELAAILQLSLPYGFNDPRFISILGGMFFLDGKFSQATRVFDESRKRQFNSTELMTPQFFPRDIRDSSKFLHIDGIVAERKAGFALIDVPSYPRIICPGSKWSGTVLERGMNIEIRLVFCPKGPLAIEPRQR